MNKILVVDDDRLTRLLLRKTLAQEPQYEMTEACDGWEAWQLLQNEAKPDLCILDIMMPRMNGLELLEKMRFNQQLKHLKVMMCSAVNERFLVAQATSYDICSYLVKPIIPQRVLEQVRKVFKPSDMAELSSRKPDKSLREMEEYLDRLQTLAKETNQELEVLRSSINEGDRASASTQLLAIADAGRRFGITGLMDAAIKLEARIMTDSQDGLVAGLHRVEAENQAILDVATKLAQKQTMASVSMPGRPVSSVMSTV